MIAALILCSLGEILFSEQDIPGLRVLEVNPLNGKPTLNILQGDISGDGLTDLVLNDQVLLQKAGRFNALPALKVLVDDRHSVSDIYGGALYIRHTNGLIAYRWNGNEWVTTLDQRIAWPKGTLPSDDLIPNQSRFERFLHDIDDDRTPEIVIPSENGLHIYSRSKDSYTQATLLDIFPQPRQITPPPAKLWPPEARRLLFPSMRTRFRTYVDGAKVVVITKENHTNGKIRFNWSTYRLDPNQGFAANPKMTRNYTSQLLPEYFQPCDLNNDGLIDFAGSTLAYSHAYPLPAPVFETAATLDLGVSIRHIRARSFRPLSSFIDINGDSNIDLVVETTELFDGGIRDVLTRSLSDHTLDHQVRAYFQHRDGTFSKKADVSTRHRIRFGKPPLRAGEMFERYKTGKLLNFTGDFNGDGQNDLLIQETPKRLAVYLNKSNRFQQKPDHLLPIPERWLFGVADIDIDGRSDVLLYPPVPGASETQSRGRIWFAREVSE